MGRVLRLDLEYDGAAFAGWAAQPGRRTVEGVLHAALVTLLGDAAISVAGRTDAGVHATGQVASVVTGSDMPAPRLLRGLAGILPPDLAARAVGEAPEGFDARRDAVTRRYAFRVLQGPPSPLRRRRVLHHHGRPLEVEAMRDAAARCIGQHDFRAFTPTETQHVFFRRTLVDCDWQAHGDEVVLVVEGDAFLRHMVRVLAGTMLLVGRGRRGPEWLDDLLAGAPRAAAGPTAPAHPLTLTGVRYAGVAMDDPALDAALVGGRRPARVEVVPHDPRWADVFRVHAARVSAALGPHLVAAEHIGSTAVPGLAAKPVVDLLAVVEAVDGPCDDLVWRMEAAGYTLRVREPGHLAFRGAGGEANVHLWPAGAPEIPRYLALREALRASAADRDRYAAVKRVLAGRVWADTNHYAAAKGPVIASILRRAGV